MYSIAVVGSTNRTVQCAQALVADHDFELTWVLTPEPKSIGRHHLITKNPVHQFAEQQQLPFILIKDKIDQTIQDQIKAIQNQQKTQLDFLLVVDFGYLVPDWLLQLPQLAPLNIHPSALPQWRGSSPGQLVLLTGQTKSAISLMIMNQHLDQGPIVAQFPFTVLPTWTTSDYYRLSFDLICPNLATTIKKYAQHQIIPHEQPLASPTPIAKKLNKEDSFIAWSVVAQACGINYNMKDHQISQLPTASLLQSLFQQTAPAIVLERATRAFTPWPNLWTLIPTTKGLKRMKICQAHLNHEQLVLDQVQIEGLQPSSWAQVKNLLT